MGEFLRNPAAPGNASDVDFLMPKVSDETRGQASDSSGAVGQSRRGRAADARACRK